VAFAGVLWRLMPADRPAAARVRRDRPTQLLRGPVGAIATAAMLVAVASTTFHAGLPLWLTRDAGYRGDSSIIGWTFVAFELAAAAGGLLAAWSACRISPARIATVTLAIAPFALV